MKSGIYKIENKVNGKLYIGLSINIKERWIAHKVQLRKNIHYNSHLQASWNKYGEDSFIFSILEHCEVDKLSNREKYYIDLYDTYNNGYNMTPGGENGTTGIYNGNHNKTKYTFYNFDGRIESNTTLMDFCIKYNYDYRNCHIYSVAAGTRDIFDGWVTDKNVLEQSRRGAKYIFYNIDGRITEYLTQSQFNIMYELNSDSAISALILGKVKQFKGWFKSEDDINSYKQQLIKNKRDIINESGEVKYNVTQKEFRELTGCDSCSSSQLFSGKYKIVKGWKIK